MSEKPSDWIRDRAQEYMPSSSGLGLTSRPNAGHPDTFGPWVSAILDYFDKDIEKFTPTEKEEIASSLRELLERIDG